MNIVEKVYGKIVIEQVKITEDKISEEEEGFRKGIECVDQIFSLRVAVETIVTKGMKVYIDVLYVDSKNNISTMQITKEWVNSLYR